MPPIMSEYQVFSLGTEPASRLDPFVDLARLPQQL